MKNPDPQHPSPHSDDNDPHSRPDDSGHPSSARHMLPIPPDQDYYLDRFWSKVTPLDDGADTCWIFKANSTTKPVTDIKFDIHNRGYAPHRVSYELQHGPGSAHRQQIRRSCSNVRCVRPTHLYVYTVGAKPAPPGAPTGIGRPRGSTNRDRGPVTLSEAQQIRHRHEVQGLPSSILAKEYDLSRSHIQRILRGDVHPDPESAPTR